jgi:hypothetical protein
MKEAPAAWAHSLGDSLPFKAGRRDYYPNKLVKTQQSKMGDETLKSLYLTIELSDMDQMFTYRLVNKSVS